MEYSEAKVAAAVPDDPAPVPPRLQRGIDLERVSFRHPGDDPPEGGSRRPGRQRLSGGFEDFARIELLLRESVGLGDMHGEGAPAIDDDRRLDGALRRAASRLPAVGLDCQLGAQWPGGVDLSTGQWQKVALARGLLRHDPLLLLLDEPTSGLDPGAEHAVFEAFRDAAVHAARRTGAVVLLVSHRFSTVRMADHIVVLAGGRVVEQAATASSWPPPASTPISTASRPGHTRSRFDTDTDAGVPGPGRRAILDMTRCAAQSPSRTGRRPPSVP